MGPVYQAATHCAGLSRLAPFDSCARAPLHSCTLEQSLGTAQGAHMPQKVRIGIIGAGAFTTGRMLPGFQKTPDVEISVVANRSRASGEKVAAAFGIPR